MSEIEKKIADLGFTLPEMSKPANAYIPAIVTGDLVYTSGCIPSVDGQTAYSGHVGAEVSPEDGYKAAQICALNCLAAAKLAIGDLDRIDRVIKLLGFVSSAPGFTAQSQVVNGASELLIKIFGENGEHARSSIGVIELPGNVPVEVEMILRLK